MSASTIATLEAEKRKTAPAAAYSVPSQGPAPKQAFLFDRDNYMWMAGGAALILIGMFLLSGGKSPDPHQYNFSEIYSFRRITLAPIMIVLGFAAEVYAIMKKPKEHVAAI